MDKQTHPTTPQRTAQDLHDAIVAHNRAMKEAVLLLLTAPDNLSDEVLTAAQKICGAMADLTGFLEPLVPSEAYDALVEDHFG